jgi:hypothetical protein
MPKRKLPPLTQEEQSERFLKAVADLEAAGELREDAAERFERTLGNVAVEKSLDES